MEHKREFTIHSIGELLAVAEYLIKASRKTSKVVLLTGDLAAGKTTLVKQIAARLGCEDETSSPTYSLVNEYAIQEGKMYHIDLYRLNNTHEAIDMGIEEYIDSDAYCFIEWPQIIVPLVHDHWSVDIQVLEDGRRSITLEYKE